MTSLDKHNLLQEMSSGGQFYKKYIHLYENKEFDKDLQRLNYYLIYFHKILNIFLDRLQEHQKEAYGSR